MKITLSTFLFILISLISLPLFADQYDADRHQMKLMMVDIQKKLNQRQFDAMLSYLDKNAVVTFYDARTAVGPEQVSQYIQKMLTGPAPVLKDFSVEGVEDVPARVYPNNTATAQGGVKNKLHFITGENMEVNGRWTVTLLKEGGEWKIIALHFSTNLFDNPIVHSLERKIIYLVIFALVIGLLIGYLISRFTQKRRVYVSR